MLVHILAAPILIQLCANVPAKVAEDGLSVWGLVMHSCLLASAWFSSANFGHLENESAMSHLSVFPFCDSAFEINKYFNDISVVRKSSGQR